LTPPTSPRRGPDLPYSIVGGVKPCATGWLVAGAKLHGTTFAPESLRVIESFVDVIDQRPGFSVIALSAPIGYLDEVTPGGRSCDRQARKLLGRRGSAIHSAPAYAVLEAGGDGTDDHLDAISKKLLPRYREVAAEMAPYRQRTIYEVNPELSFYHLNGEVPLLWSKNSAEGLEERRGLLTDKIPGAEGLLSTEISRVPTSHLLDVAALLWTARRIFARAGIRIPSDPEWDEQGLRMEFVY